MTIHGGIHDIDDAVPPALLVYRHFAPWRLQPNKKTGVVGKVPFNPKTGQPAKPDSPSTFGSWAEAKARLPKLLADFGQRPEGGMGILLGVDQGGGTTIGGMDLDTCYVAGNLAPWAAEIIELFNSYTEISPSGGGAHVLFRYKTSELEALKAAAGGKSVLWRGAKIDGSGHSPGIEIYLDLRFFTVSGNRVGDCRELVTVSAPTVARLSGIAAKLPRTTSKVGKRANGAPDRSAMATSVLVGLLQGNAGLTFDEGMAALAGADEPLVVEWYEEQVGSKAGDRQLQRHWDFAVKSAAELRSMDKVTRGGIVVPDDAGTFAGMSASEVIADICHVSKGDWWWSHRHAEPFTTTGLNTALNSLYRQLIRGWKNPPRTFVAWFKACSTITNYTGFVRRGGQPPVCETELGAGDEAVNRWRPLPPVPEEVLDRVRREGPAAVRPWVTLAGDICNDNKEQVEVLLDWAAFVAMEPGFKPGWSVVSYSAIQGIGKDMLSYGLSRTLGRGAYTTIPRKTLERDFNTHLTKRLIHVSDLYTTTRNSMNGSDVYSTLKQVTSNLPKTIEVNPKHEPPYDADNLSAWIISTNDEAPMTIPAEDRRWFVIEGRDTKREDAFYAAASDWLDAPDTGNLIRGFLQLRWESLSAARRAAIRGIAPETEAKLQMIDAGMTPVMTKIKELLTSNDCPDLIALRDISEHLHNLKQADRLPRNAPLPNPTVLGIWMKTKFRVPGVPVGKDGKPYAAVLPDKTTVRLYAVRRAATYAPLTGRDVGRLYAQQTEKGRLFTAKY